MSDLGMISASRRSALEQVVRVLTFLAVSGCSVDERKFDAGSEPALPGGGGATSPDAPDGGAGGGASNEVVQSMGGATGAGGEPKPVVAPSKLDLLFMIDNSISMSDKQEILRQAVPDLMNRLVNPICIDASGGEYPSPAAGADCPSGQRRQFNPIADIHVGIITSSMGDIGANMACPGAEGLNYRQDRVDMAHLIGTLDRGTIAGNTQGFLEWRAGSDLARFTSDFQFMLAAVGETGCGWEGSLESWYRFLVDPRPYRSLLRVPCDPGGTGTNCVAPSVDGSGQLELDEPLLAQRAAFLRPDSLVAIVMLTDENDCSLQLSEQNWVVVAIDDSRPMFRGTSACDADPNSKCCRGCTEPAPEGCPADPVCTDVEPDAGLFPDRLTRAEDGLNLRCFDQKRRFGTDFLYPTSRYVNALTHEQLCLDHPDLNTEGCPSPLVPNPLFAGGRSRQQVLLAGILGVPWQAIASSVDQNGRPLANPDRQLRFKLGGELTNADWDRIAGSPGTPWREATADLPEVSSTPRTPPLEPTMVESAAVRPNVRVGNPINGREFDTGQGFDSLGALDDLQYACIFPLPVARDCTQRDVNAGDACDCFAGEFDRPLCEATPGNGTPGTTQFWAKAYPGLRQLQVLRGLGDSSVVGSICARNTTDNDRPDFGYRPAVAALVERLRTQFAPPSP